MSRIILYGITEDQLFDRLDFLLQKRIGEAIANHVQEKWLSVDEARKIWQPAISRNTLTKWSALYSFKAERFGGTIKYLFSDLLKQSKIIKQYSKP